MNSRRRIREAYRGLGCLGTGLGPAWVRSLTWMASPEPWGLAGVLSYFDASRGPRGRHWCQRAARPCTPLARMLRLGNIGALRS
jgi:hypothetical protein